MRVTSRTFALLTALLCNVFALGCGRYQCVAEMHFQKAISQYSAEATLPTAVLGRLEARLDLITCQVAHDPHVGIAALASLAAGVQKVFAKQPPSIETVASITSIEASVGKVLLSAIKVAPAEVKHGLKDVYKQLFIEMKSPLTAEATKSDLIKKGARLGALLRSVPAG